MRLFFEDSDLPQAAPTGASEMQVIWVSAAKILVEDISNEYRRRRKNDTDVARSRTDTYIRSSLRTAFAQVLHDKVGISCGSCAGAVKKVGRRVEMMVSGTSSTPSRATWQRHNCIPMATKNHP
ncbi:hypothetical protein HanXRQr2_Chr04g0146081 [Helianthus annuus]|uniref:Uncharacterized protein n=1 Tax=Helianthus annuus TaxID=4232 RepID=A0A251U864_HELAN|nr:hypothetical protein HanXRQr2_Chr04g0146081 [Helianthus annuus]